ncbi:hypothetical protein AB1Y20_022320 [Prymnesium parvum]|uniref:Major facilitator superfamily (MFS) profile domain-containing protein n=1 Tax=Prymnesium parvum TaxID=97485 RepID=A0AB34JFV7_PRYPA
MALAGPTERSFALLMACTALITSDQSLLAPNLSATAAEFGFDELAKDEKLGGSLAVALFLAGAPAALLIGAAADQVASRASLLALVLLFGAVGCGGSAVAADFSQLWYARALAGVALGGAVPVCFSFIGDMFDLRERAVKSGQIGLAMTVGTLAGQSISGLMGPALGWRAPFVLISTLMLLLVKVIPSALEEPPREIAHSPLLPSSPHLKKSSSFDQIGRWSALLRIPSLWLVYLQGVPGCVPWGVVSTFLPDYLHADLGFSVHEATFITTAFTLGGLLGTHAGGQLGQALHNSSSTSPAILMLSAGIIGVFPMRALILYPPSSVTGCAMLCAFGGFLATQTGPNIRAVLCNVTQSDQRGLAFAAFALADDVGKGFGPLAIALLIRRLGRKEAFACSMLLWIPCALVCGATAFTVKRDEARARNGLKNRSNECLPDDSSRKHDHVDVNPPGLLRSREIQL